MVVLRVGAVLVEKSWNPSAQVTAVAKGRTRYKAAFAEGQNTKTKKGLGLLL